MLKQIALKPIGFVKTEMTEDELREQRSHSYLILKPEYEEALSGIEAFSHLNVIFWMNKITRSERKTLKARPRGRRDMPLLGVFATRSPHRPNPIGLTLVELMGRRRNIIKVKGLDALDGTPILDLKPYDYWDSARRARVPKWWKKLERERLSR